jgi:hypothetical protein|tara:strand:- start:70 stop:783 length:714 start_codon:yes stop_codon:yes gene_type:complete
MSIKIDIKWRDGSSDCGHSGFCCISDNNEQSGGFSSCRDYIQDLHAYFINNKIPNGSYAFRAYHLGHKNPSKKNIKVAYHPSSYGDVIFSIPKALNYIHQVEKAFRFSTLSKIGLSSRRNTFIAIGNKKWLLATPMISFYTFLLRTSPFHTVGVNFIKTFKKVADGDSIDRYTAGSLLGVIDKMIELGVKKIFSGTKIKNYPDRLHTHNVGIGGFSDGDGRTCCSHWYEGWYNKIGS